MPVTDDQRHKLEDALLAALLLIGTGWAKRAGQHLATRSTPQLSTDARAKLKALALETSALVQTGTNHILEAPDGSVYANQTPQQRFDGIRQYNRDTLIPNLAATAANLAVHDVYQFTPDPKGSGQSAKDATPWVWVQTKNGNDGCRDAAGASPASYGDLVSIAGGEPAAHRSCGCYIVPADWLDSWPLN